MGEVHSHQRGMVRQEREVILAVFEIPEIFAARFGVPFFSGKVRRQQLWNHRVGRTFTSTNAMPTLFLSQTSTLKVLVHGGSR